MKLIKIETQGFKSFANKIKLNFDGGVVGIVGPNGSGKSNINDAIKWVLGEQSIKSLRADNSEEVIFSGSKTVEASNVAKVSLTFDNHNKIIDVPYQKINITRVLKRGKSSNQYLINGQEARLKDIKTIAMESGIGKSSLAIISQGTIANIAEASPEQRREIFEEAAGISKYKSRKKEALRKLDATTEDLEKIRTVTQELEKQINPLKRQVEKAKIYLHKKKQLQDMEIALIIEDVAFFCEKLQIIDNQLEGIEDQKNRLENNISKLESQIQEKNQQKLKIDNEIVDLANQLQNISDKLYNIEINESKISERRNMIISNKFNTNKQTKSQALKEELDYLLKKIHQYEMLEKQADININASRKIIFDSQEKILKVNFKSDECQSKLMALKAKLWILKENATKKMNFFIGVKTIIENSNIFPGLKGIVADLIKPQANYENAIAAILSARLQHIVVDHSQTAIKAINFLKNNKSGKASFIPLQSIKPKFIIQEHEMVLKNLPGYLGQAANLTKIEKPEYEILNKFLLGNVIVANTIENANTIAKTIENKYLVVSQDGDMIRPGGVMFGGQKNKVSELIDGTSQIKKLEAMILPLATEIENWQNQKNNLHNLVNENLTIVNQINIEKATRQEKMTTVQTQFNNLKTSYEVLTQAKFVYNQKNMEIDAKDQLVEKKVSIQNLLKAKREAMIDINHQLSIITTQKNEFEKKLRHLITSSSEHLTQKKHAEFIIDASKKRLLEEYEMTIANAQKWQKKILKNKEETRKKVQILKKEIKELGHINLDAIAMFDKINVRYQKFSDSEQELSAAQQKIITAIGEMDQVIVTRLDETVRSINKEFNNVFTSMFGGGNAKVRYKNPQDLLETGIEVMVQPPGKTIKNLKLFSGGEKSMIAISLLFAILKARPLPLCILDEVEAALDDTNVIRYATYLQELKKQTQFIIITHRVGTMSHVDYLFGATMQHKGVTSFFSIKLEEAKKIIN